MVTVSDTAYAVATVRAREAELPLDQRLFEDPYAAIFRDAGAHVAEHTERLLALPVVTEQVRLRTRFLDDFVRDGLASGIAQVVLFGAGFDMRGLRLPEIAAGRARVYEVDLAPLLDRKRALLVAAGVSVPGHVAHVACDFMDPDFGRPLAESLAASGFRRRGGAIFVWEGVLPYIDGAAMDRSLAFMAHEGGPSSRLAFDYAEIVMEPPAAERARRAGFDAFVETHLEVLWRRHLRTEPHPYAAAFRLGIARM